LFTIRHFHLFDVSVSKKEFSEEKLDSAESWDMLRMREPLFSIPDTREEWVTVSELAKRKDGQDGRLIERGQDIAAFFKEQRITSVFAVGSGGAGLEYQIKKAYPGLRLVCSDFAPKTVLLLKKVFDEAEEVIRFDILHDEWTPITDRTDAGTTACLIYRLDAQLTDREWREVFARMAARGVRHVLYIPTGFLTLYDLLYRLRSRLKWWLAGKESVFSGYLRTKMTFHSFWKSHFSEQERVLGGMCGFWLSAIK